MRRGFELRKGLRLAQADSPPNAGTAAGPRPADGTASPVTAAPVRPAPVTVYVCVTCRGGEALDVVPVPGEVLLTETVRLGARAGIRVEAVRCLANCNRGLSAALRREGAWTYVFGGLAAGGAHALIEGAQLFARSADGLLPWRGRPDALKRGLIARTPPVEGAAAIAANDDTANDPEKDAP